MTYINLYEGSSVESALEFYTGKGYELINSYMRDEDITEIVYREYDSQLEGLDEDEIQEAVEEVEESLDTIINELHNEFTEATKDMTVYRGGERSNGFISTSLDINEAKKFGEVEKIEIKKGDLIIDTRGKSWTEGEDEIILFIEK